MPLYSLGGSIAAGQAAASAAAAAASAADAATQAANALTQAQNSLSFANSASASASAAASSVTTAASDVVASATTQATNAANSASAAATQAANALNSANSAADSANNATTAAGNASAAATSAGASLGSAISYAATATTEAGLASASASAAAASAASAASASLTALGSSNFSFKNGLLNGDFRIFQRGTGPFTASNGYTADRWQMIFVGGSMSTSIVDVNDAFRSAIGDESAAKMLQVSFAGSTAATAYTQFFQNIEDVRRYAGKNVTVSFWAITSATINMGVRVQQNFGTGGSPSSGVQVTTQSVTVYNGGSHYSLTFAVPSTAGKVLGTNNDSSLGLWFTFSAGSSYASANGVPGPQSATVNLWGIQLEEGTVATVFEKRPNAIELTLCQRFYQTGQLYFSGYGAAASGVIGATTSLSTSMRAGPTVGLTASYGYNVAGTLSPLLNSFLFYQGNNSAVGNWNVNIAYTASAEL